MTYKITNYYNALKNNKNLNGSYIDSNCLKAINHDSNAAYLGGDATNCLNGNSGSCSNIYNNGACQKYFTSGNNVKAFLSNLIENYGRPNAINSTEVTPVSPPSSTTQTSIKYIFYLLILSFIIFGFFIGYRLFFQRKK